MVVAGLSAAGSAAGAQAQSFKIIVVTHGQASDPFWSVVKAGVDQAAKDMNVTAQYQSPDKFDMVAMGQLIDAAVAAKPDGLVVSLPDASALGPHIKAAVDAGIPVITINSGSDAAQKLGVLAHIGQDEYSAGFGAGQKMAAAGAKNALCVNQEVGNAGLDARCKGFDDAMVKAGSKTKVLAVDLTDPTGAQNRVGAAIQADASIDSILTLGPTGASPALAALQSANLVGKIKIATFDLSPDVLKAVQKGDMLFAIDQQQYLQGYLPIAYLSLYLRNLNTPGAFLIPTGPGFVTKDTAARVIDLSKAGTR
jgi:simple sugar transport system substrate-binding protein